jgi:uncharacterized protein (DUF488 family)
MFKLFTIGFTKKSADHFIELLKKHKVSKLVDIRINNTSQLAGFAKGPDLEYFVNTILNIPYIHIKDFAPTKELLKDYRAKKINWIEYQKIFIQLIEKRKILQKYDISQFDHACFLCSEESPDECHRRLLAEYFKEKKGDVEIIHLK